MIRRWLQEVGYARHASYMLACALFRHAQGPGPPALAFAVSPSLLPRNPARNPRAPPCQVANWTGRYWSIKPNQRQRLGLEVGHEELLGTQEEEEEAEGLGGGRRRGGYSSGWFGLRL